MKHLYLLPLGLALNSTAFADLGRPGISGEVSLLAGYSGGKSNLSTDHETKTDALNSPGESTSQTMFMPLGQIRYTFGNQQLYLGTDRGDIIEGVLAAELGYALAFGRDSVLSIAYLPTVASGEVWADPYLTNSRRETTDISGNTYRIQYENMLNSRVSGDFAFYEQTVDDDRSASRVLRHPGSLLRDAHGYYASLSTGLPIGANSFLSPSVSYQDHQADGKAMSFQRYGVSLTYMHRFGNQAIVLNSEYAGTSYETLNDIFHLKQSDKGYGAHLSYEYYGIMGWRNWSLVALVGYSKNDSNIKFYEEVNYLTGVGLSCEF